MRTGRINQIKSVDEGSIKVIQRGTATTGPIDMSKPAVGVDHTTESSVIPGSFSRGIPHMCPGAPRLGARPILTQWLPLGQYGTALENHAGGVETNRWIRMQIEIVGFSSLEPWLPANKELRVILASLYEFAEQELGIPERSAYKTELGPGVWAVESNPHRVAAKFGKEAGWFGHVDVPENDHWDPGSLKRDVLLGLEDEPRLVIRYGLKSVWRVDGHKESTELTKPNLTLKEVGQAIATRPELRATIKSQQAKGHRIVIARRAIPA